MTKIRNFRLLQLFSFSLVIGFTAPVDALTQQAENPATPEVTPRRRASWTSDRRDYRVGDVIMLWIDEQTTAQGRRRRRDESGRDFGASASANVNGTTALPPSGAGVGIESRDSDSHELSRRDQLSSTMSVRVEEILPGGVLRVQGEREVSVDRHKQTMRVAGLLRPEDVSSNASAHSSRLAEAKIEYRGRKPMIRPGFITRALTWLWP